MHSRFTNPVGGVRGDFTEFSKSAKKSDIITKGYMHKEDTHRAVQRWHSIDFLAFVHRKTLFPVYVCVMIYTSNVCLCNALSDVEKMVQTDSVSSKVSYLHIHTTLTLYLYTRTAGLTLSSLMLCSLQRASTSRL